MSSEDEEITEEQSEPHSRAKGQISDGTDDTSDEEPEIPHVIDQ